jgi:hypothetical protein
VRALDVQGSTWLGWPELAALCERVALGVVFGPEARATGAALSTRLTRLLREANRIFGLKQSEHLIPFYEEIHRRLGSPPPASLIGRFGLARPRPETAAENQIPHWMFATRDTLPANVLNALALIASHPEVARRAAAEIEAADTATPEGIAGLQYLQACLDETMRLWPTTMMLVREALVDDVLGGESIRAGTQVIIHNGFNHRNPETVPEPDRFLPERWLPPMRDYRFNHMSNGGQSCVGRKLALFLGRAVLAGILRTRRVGLAVPALGAGRPIPHGVDTYRIRRTCDPVTRAG